MLIGKINGNLCSGSVVSAVGNRTVTFYIHSVLFILLKLNAVRERQNQFNFGSASCTSVDFGGLVVSVLATGSRARSRPRSMDF